MGKRSQSRKAKARNNAQRIARSPVLDAILSGTKPTLPRYSLNTLSDDGLIDEIDWQNWLLAYLEDTKAQINARFRASEARKILRSRERTT